MMPVVGIIVNKSSAPVSLDRTIADGRRAATTNVNRNIGRVLTDRSPQAERCRGRLWGFSGTVDEYLSSSTRPLASSGRSSDAVKEGLNIVFVSLRHPGAIRKKA